MTIIALCPPQFAPHASEMDVLKGNWIEKYDGAHVCIARFSGCANRRLRHEKVTDAFRCVINDVLQSEICRSIDPFGRPAAAGTSRKPDGDAHRGSFVEVAYDRIAGAFILFADLKGYGHIRYRITESGYLQVVCGNLSSTASNASSRSMGRFRRNIRLDVERLNFERLAEGAVLTFQEGEVKVSRELERGPASTLHAYLTKTSRERV